MSCANPRPVLRLLRPHASHGSQSPCLGDCDLRPVYKGSSECSSPFSPSKGAPPIVGAEKVYKAVVKALRDGGPTGRGKRIGRDRPIFAVPGKNRQLDKIGIGYSEDYTNITWKDIET